MASTPLLISQGTLTRQSLIDQVAIVTGAGGGIGYEAARALVWLGAKVVIAEIDKEKGKSAERKINQEFGAGVCLFIQTDVGDEKSIDTLKKQAERAYGKVDIVINNATLAPLGGVLELPISDWDLSYRVNLRGPVLLARAFIPGMLQRNSGVFMCVSSVGGAYMGAYECAKTGQVELARTLDSELENTGVIPFTLSPGIVPTQTALQGVAGIAARYGKTTEEFFETYREQWVSVEAAGAGMAAAAALAPTFRGLETYSKAGLTAAGIEVPDQSRADQAGSLLPEQLEAAIPLCQEVQATLAGEYQGWLKRPLFERQWMLRDFKQNSGFPAEEAIARLGKLLNGLQQQDWAEIARQKSLPGSIAQYYQHYRTLAESSVKDTQKRIEYLSIIQGWQVSAERLAELLEA